MDKKLPTDRTVRAPKGRWEFFCFLQQSGEPGEKEGKVRHQNKKQNHNGGVDSKANNSKCHADGTVPPPGEIGGIELKFLFGNHTEDQGKQSAGQDRIGEIEVDEMRTLAEKIRKERKGTNNIYHEKPQRNGA